MSFNMEEYCYHIYDKDNQVLAHNLSKEELKKFFNDKYEVEKVKGCDYNDASY